jgi:quinol monooxygenase YgiN
MKRRAKSRRAIKSRRKTGAKKTRLPKDAVTLTVILRAREGQETLLEAELRALVIATRREEGCMRFDLHRAEEPPGTFLLHEIWASHEAHLEHRKLPHFLRYDARKDPLLLSRNAIFWKQVL